MNMVFIICACLSVLLAFIIPTVIDKLINRPSAPIKFCKKAKKELYDNGYECKMDEGWLLVKVSGHGIAIGFNENTYGKGVCILVRAYALIKEWYPDINIDGIRVLTDYANREFTIKSYIANYEPGNIIIDINYCANSVASIVSIVNNSVESFNHVFGYMNSVYEEMLRKNLYKSSSSKGMGNPIGFRSNVDKNVASDANIEESEDVAAKTNNHKSIL